MKKNRLNILAMVLLTALALYAAPAQAECNCEPATPEEQEVAAEAIFVAHALGPNEEANNGIWTTFALKAVQKQTDAANTLLSALVVGDERRVRMAQKLSNCNFNFEEDKTYTIFATIAQSEKGVSYLTTSQCAGTKENTEDAPAEEKTLENAPQQPAEEPTDNKGQ